MSQSRKQLPNMNTYEIAITSVWWTDGGEDRRMFKTISEREEYFSSRSLFYSPLSNFPINDGNVTEINFQYQGNEFDANSIREFLNNNYAVVRWQVDGIYTYRYYFARLRQVGGDIFKVALTLDDIVTNYTNIRLAGCLSQILIERCHLDRFVQTSALSNKIVKLNGNPDSPFIMNNEFEDTSILTNKLPINFKHTNYYDLVDNELNRTDNCIVGWAYVFYNYPSTEELKYPYEINGIKYGDVSVLVFPVLQSPSNVSFVFKGQDREGNQFTYQLYDSDSGISRLNSAYILGIKVSNISPFGVLNENVDITVTKSSATVSTITFNDVYQPEIVGPTGVTIDKRLTVRNSFSVWVIPLGTAAYGNDPCVLAVSRVSSKVLGYDIDLTSYLGNYVNSMNISELSELKEFNPLLEPLVYSKPITNLKLSCYNGQSFTYDILELNTPNLTPVQVEPMALAVSRGVLALTSFSDNLLDTNTFTIYNENYLSSYICLSYSADNSLIFNVSRLEEFFTSNKNYYLNNISNMAIGLAGGISRGPIGIANSIISAGATGLEMYMQLDNLRAMPDTIKNTASDTYLNMSLRDEQQLRMYLEIWKTPQIQLERITHFLHLYGYRYSNSAYLEDIDSSRYYFNYIKTSEPLIFCYSNVLSHDAKQRLSDIFITGVRLWHTDNMRDELGLENLETSIIESKGGN